MSKHGRSGIVAPHVLYHPGSHASIVENVKLLAEEGVETEPLPIRGARVDCEALANMIRPETVLITMEAVCGETGIIWNTREVASVLHGEVRLPRELEKSDFPMRLHVDASQAPLTEKITRAHFGADLLTLDGSKVGSPRGIGILVAHRTPNLIITPLYRGGGQEHGVRPGSESPELARSFAACLRQAAKNQKSFRMQAESDRTALITELASAIPNMHINEGPPGRQAPHIVNVSLPGRDTDYLVALLDEAGFAVSTKSACETDSGEGSRAVFALTGDEARAKATIRISWHDGVRARDLQRFAKACIQAVRFIDSHNGG